MIKGNERVSMLLVIIIPSNSLNPIGINTIACLLEIYIVQTTDNDHRAKKIKLTCLTEPLRAHWLPPAVPFEVP